MTFSQKIDILAVFVDVGFLLENTAVFQSQVGDQLIALSRLGYSVGLLAASKDRQLFDTVLGQRLRAAGVDITLVQAASFPLLLLQVTAALRSLAASRSIRKAYVRGLWGAVVIAGSGTGVPYVYDVRGDLTDELIASGVPAWKRKVYTLLERWAIRRAAAVTAVSHALADLVAQLHGSRLVSVVPCCIDSAAMTAADREASAQRPAFGFSNEDTILVYSGGLSHYQQVPSMLAIWRELLADTGLKFLLLTNDDPHKSTEVVGSLVEFGPRLVRRSLPRDRIAPALAACDIGFMLRDARGLNRAASPVKFPEYLCAGLSIVGSPGTGDASELIERNDVGILVDPADVPGAIRQIEALIGARRNGLETCRSRSRLLGRKHYDWLEQADTFARLYGEPSAGTVRT